MSLALKICGMRELQNIREVAALQPDYMGFIFYPASPRFVGYDFKVPTDFPSTIKRVGVFVKTEIHAIIEQAKIHSLDYVQLHSNESVVQCEKVTSAGHGVIKVFSVDEQFDFNTTNQFQHCADYFLFDTKGKYYGGNATSFDWTLLTKYNQQKPFFLSGGIMVDQVAAIQALKGMNIHALDVNSGVEVAPAVKSINQIREFKQALSARML
jgi:phosphoribosylanthranilate isomerase